MHNYQSIKQVKKMLNNREILINYIALLKTLQKTLLVINIREKNDEVSNLFWILFL